MSTSDRSQCGRATRRPWALLGVSLATFMTLVDADVVNVALPAIQHDLELPTAALEWLVSGYLLTFATLVLAAGGLADAFGRRRLLVAGLVVFTGASLAAALARSDGVLVGARALQGVGGALVTPTALAVVSSLYPDVRERARALGLWTAVGGSSMALGPLIGGLLTEHASWAWIFLINVPLGLVTLAVIAWAVPDSPDARSSRLDLPGLALSCLALGALTWALIEGGDHSWAEPRVLGGLVVSVLAGILFVQVERTSAAPMVDLSLFRVPAFAGGVVAVALWGFSQVGIGLYVALYLQDDLGLSPVTAGLALVPMALCIVTASVVSSRLARTLGTAPLVTVAMVLIGLGLGSQGLLGDSAACSLVVPGLMVAGVGGGLITPLTGSVLTALPPAHAGLAAAVFSAARQVGGLMGVSVLGDVLHARQAGAAAGGAGPRAAWSSGYHLVALVAAGLLLVGALVAWRALQDVPAGAGRTTA